LSASSTTWSTSRPPGEGLAILVNANAKRGGRRIAVQIARVLNGASVRLTKNVSEIAAWLRVLKNPRCILAAGGDGTVIALINAANEVWPDTERLPVIGILPLGTGNGWAHALGAPKLDRCLRILQTNRDPFVTRRYSMFTVEGSLAHFAGCGYDAMILEDYKQQLAQSKGPANIVSKSVYGYLTATLLRTTPKIMLHGLPNVIVENLGDIAYTMTADSKILEMNGVGRGAVLYDGPAGCASVGTAPEFGYGFRAFPFAERMPGYINVRIYDHGPLRAVSNIPKLWKGTHPMVGMHDWFVKAARMTFSRMVPLQVGGDALGMRRTVEYRIAPRPVDMLDWRRML
jgi:diacylglycerol kinase family enzyme